MDDKPNPNRGELMRQLAKLYAKTATGFSKQSPLAPTGVALADIKKQIAALEKRLMDV